MRRPHALPAALSRPDGVRSPLGRQFRGYLGRNGRKLYGGDFHKQAKDFAAAAGSAQRGLKETATYCGCTLNKGQAGASSKSKVF